MISRSIFIAVPVLLAACTSHVRMQPISPEILQLTGKESFGTEIRGVIVYLPMLVKVTYTFTKFTNEKGVMSESTCEKSTQKVDLVTLPDFSRPMVIRSGSGFPAPPKFSVTMANGLLTAVNTEPSEKPSDLIKAVGEAAAPFVKQQGVAAAGVACNASPVISTIERATIP